MPLSSYYSEREKSLAAATRNDFTAPAIRCPVDLIVLRFSILPLFISEV